MELPDLAWTPGRLTDGQFVKSLDVVDEYTLRMNLTEYTSMAFENYGWTDMFSPTGIQGERRERMGPDPRGRDGSLQARRLQARHVHKVRAVRCLLAQRLSPARRHRNPFCPGPHDRLHDDGGETGRHLAGRGAIKNVLELQQKGLKVNWGPGMLWALLPNSSNPKSPYANKKVREAVEYALDRPAIAKMLGFGKFEALTQIVPSASPAYVPGYNPRPYNPEKARQLLAEAGYPSGFETKLLAIDYARDAAVAVQSYLAAVGIRVNVDVADLGRYYGSLFGPTGWEDLAIARSGINPDATDLFVHFGPRPMTYRFGFIAKSPEFLAFCEKALKTYDQAGVRAALQQAVKQGGEDAMVIPLYRSAQANVMQDYVHSDYMKIHTVTWFTYQDWMEKRK